MEGEGLTLRAIVGLLRRRLLIVVACVVLALALAGASLFVLKPVYNASALVIIDPVKRSLLEPEQNYPADWDNARIDAEAQLVTSGDNLTKIATNLDLGAYPEFGGGRTGLRQQIMSFFRLSSPRDLTAEESLANAVGVLSQSVWVSRRELTNLIDIGSSTSDPELAAAIANEAARVYVESQLQGKVDSVLSAQSIIKSRIADASNNVAQSESSFDDFIEANVARISSETGRTDLTQLRQDFEDALTRRDRLGATVSEAQTRLASRDWQALAGALQTATVTDLNNERQRVAAALESADTSTDMAATLRSELQRLEGLLQDEAGKSIASLQQQVSTQQAEANDARTKLRESVLSSNLPADVLTSLYQLQQAAEISRAQYQALLTRQKDLENQAYLQIADSRVVASASPSDVPSFPQPNSILGVALMVGLVGGILIAFLVENFVGGITSEEQAESVLRNLVVSTIPKQKSARRGNSSESALVADSLMLAPLSAYSESIRRMRIGLDQAIVRATGQTEQERTSGVAIMVTSSVPNEGKTTVSLSLARAYALSGRSTLLIDCDLRKPGVHRQLGLEPSDGLIDYLSNRKHASDIQSFVTEDPGTGAQIVLGSRRSDVPTDQLVAGKTFAALVAAARRNFDVVILDTPPVGPVVDALYMAGLSDVIAYVVKWSATPQQEIKRALESVERVKPDKVQILTVINQQDKVPVGYRGRYSTYYLEA